LVDQEAAPSTSNNEPLEHQIAERLQLSLVGGEIVWIENSTEKFLGIYRPADEQPPQGAIVITSPPGTVVDSLSLLRILAESSARSGWTALSIQQPLPNFDDEAASTSKALARLNAAIGYVYEKNIENIIIVGVAKGADIAIRYVVESTPVGVVGMVGLGFWQGDLQGTEIAVLDVVGTRDKRALAQQQSRIAKNRQRTIAVNSFEIAGADPEFTGYESQVAKRIRGWLDRTTASRLEERPATRPANQPQTVE
jgi:hypothetical protein